MKSLFESNCIDNLAHIWVQEKKLTKEDGVLLPNSLVGFFGERYKLVLDSRGCKKTVKMVILPFS